MGIGVTEGLLLVIGAVLTQLGEHRFSDVAGELPGHRPIAVLVTAGFVEHRQDRMDLAFAGAATVGLRGGNAERLAELEVLLSAAGSDMDDAGTVGGADFVPDDHLMAVTDRLADGVVIEGPTVTAADEVGAFERLQDLEGSFLFENLGPLLGQIVDLSALTHLDVVKLRMDGTEEIGEQRPRRRRPHQQELVSGGETDVRIRRFVAGRQQRQLGVDRLILDLLVAFADFLLGDTGAAARTPGHAVEALVDQATLVTLLEERPDGVVVLVRHGEVRVIPVHPVAETDGLVGLHLAEAQHALLAVVDELLETVVLDLFLGRESLLALDFYLDPQSLAVEAVLEALVESTHGVEALVDVFERAPPGVVDAHRVVGGNRAVEERPMRLTAILLDQFLESVFTLPELEDLPLFLGGYDIGHFRLLCDGGNVGRLRRTLLLERLRRRTRRSLYHDFRLISPPEARPLSDAS